MIKSFNKTFADKEELFSYVRSNKSLLVDAKKSEIIKSVDRNILVVSNQEKVSKCLEASKSIELDDNYYYFVVNSSNVVDSHGDMHIKGNWEKTVKEQQGKVYLVWEHTLSKDNIIAMKQDIEMFTTELPFTALGKQYTGSTYCLVYKVAKDKIEDPKAKEWLEKGYDFEASVRMQYMDIDFAMNSNHRDDIKEKANYDAYFPLIANKEELQQTDVFCIVKQAKNVNESSLVMFASNNTTGQPTKGNETEPINHSDEIKEEPTIVTQNNINFNLFI